MNKTLFLFSVPLLVGIAFLLLPNFAAQAKNGSSACTTIQSGLLKDSAGDTISTGYDNWGYNYQAHIFNGKYCDAYRGATWCQEYSDVNLQMKWNDAWMSNVDCDGDGLLDRHSGFASYRGSGAWLTNHQSGIYEDGTKWNDFIKIVAAPLDAALIDNVWYVDGTELGESIWGEFAIVQEVTNDPSTQSHGLQILSEYGPGFGHIE